MSGIHLLLKTVADAGNPGIEHLFAVSLENNFHTKDTLTAGYLVKVHLAANELTIAVRTFESQFKEKKFTSYRVPLTQALIMAKDINRITLRELRHQYTKSEIGYCFQYTGVEVLEELCGVAACREFNPDGQNWRSSTTRAE